MKDKLTTVAIILAIIGLMMLIARSGSAQAPSVEGHYLVDGVNPDGKPYTGVVEIIATGDTFHIRWTLQPHDVQVVGVGLTAGPSLVFSYVIQGRPGIVVYERQGDGWQGRWTVGGAGETWPEKLTPQSADRPAPTAEPKVKPTGPLKQS